MGGRKGTGMTEEDIQSEIDAANDEAREAAQEEYTRKTGKELRAQCRRLTEETAARYDLVMRGESPRAFGEYDRDEIARILNADVVLVFDGYDIDMSPTVETSDDWLAGAIETTWVFDADEAADRLAFIEAYEKYLYTAAAFAKSIGAAHAMRLYLRAWGLVDAAAAQGGRGFRVGAAESLRAVNLERVATERLWVEVEAAKLPKFTPRRRKAGPRRGRG